VVIDIEDRALAHLEKVQTSFLHRLLGLGPYPTLLIELGANPATLPALDSCSMVCWVYGAPTCYSLCESCYGRLLSAFRKWTPWLGCVALGKVVYTSAMRLRCLPQHACCTSGLGPPVPPACMVVFGSSTNHTVRSRVVSRLVLSHRYIHTPRPRTASGPSRLLHCTCCMTDVNFWIMRARGKSR
jgi:hypothetical protein